MRQAPAGGPNGPRRAITDLYDEERRTFLVQYPVLLVIALGLTGVAAFAITGFLGRDGWARAITPTALDDTFRQPWVLYLWFCALMLTLLASIFRDKSLRGRLIATIIVALLAVAVVAILKFSDSLPDFIQQLLRGHRLLAALTQSTATYNVINFGIIAVFWADTIRRWVRRARGLPPNPSVNLGLGDPADSAVRDPRDMPTLQELISGDLVAAAVLSALLAVVFQLHVLGSVVHPITPTGAPATPLTDCQLSWLVGNCSGGAGLSDPPTLTFIDLIQSLVFLPLGLIILALSATLSGLGAVGGVDDAALAATLPATATGEGSSTVPIAVDVSTTILKTLQSALDRRLRVLANNAILSIRTVGWPALIVFATFGLANLSIGIQAYLHSLRGGQDALNLLPGLGWGLVALLGLVFSATLLVFRWRVAENTLRFLGLVGFVVLITLWIFALALFGINKLVLLVANAGFDRRPFDPPSFATYLSAAALVLAGVFFIGLRRMRPTPRPAPGVAASPALVGASVRAGPDPGATSPRSPMPSTTETTLPPRAD
jgi:hypothetical protein